MNVFNPSLRQVSNLLFFLEQIKKRGRLVSYSSSEPSVPDQNANAEDENVHSEECVFNPNLQANLTMMKIYDLSNLENINASLLDKKMVLPEFAVPNTLPPAFYQADFWQQMKNDFYATRGEQLLVEEELFMADLFKLEDGEWISDRIVNAYLNYLSKKVWESNTTYIPTYAGGTLIYLNKFKKRSTYYINVKRIRDDRLIVKIKFQFDALQRRINCLGN